MTIIVYRQGMDSKDEWHDKESGQVYQRICAGIGWPSERPGFIAVVGEQKGYRTPSQIYLIAEHEEDTAGELLRKCVEFKSRYGVQAFYGLTSDMSNMHLLSSINKELREQFKPNLLINPAPFAETESISYHINLLLQKLSVNSKTLYLTDNSKLPSYLHEIQSSDVHLAKARDFPAVASLGYVVSALETYPFIDEAKAQKEDEERNFYDPLRPDD